MNLYGQKAELHYMCIKVILTLCSSWLPLTSYRDRQSMAETNHRTGSTNTLHRVKVGT